MDPNEIAELGHEIYARQYKEQYEGEYPGMFVAIDVDSETAYVRATPESALQDARASSPRGRFHLVEIPSAGTTV